MEDVEMLLLGRWDYWEGAFFIKVAADIVENIPFKGYLTQVLIVYQWALLPLARHVWDYVVIEIDHIIRQQIIDPQ